MCSLQEDFPSSYPIFSRPLFQPSFPGITVRDDESGGDDRDDDSLVERRTKTLTLMSLEFVLSMSCFVTCLVL